MIGKIKAFIIIMVFAGANIIFGELASAQESLQPEGYDIGIDYSLDSADYENESIIHVHRSVQNNEPFSLTGLYFSETMRNWAYVEISSLDIDGEPVDAYYTGAIHNETAPGYDTYRWVLDFPSDSLPYNIAVQSGETLNLNYDLHVNPLTGVTLPFHTACFYGTDIGFFTVADPIVIPPTGGCDPYVIGDWNGNLVFNVADIILAFSSLAGQPDFPALLCECPPGSGNVWAVAMDLNGNCAFNLADIIWGIAKLKGQGNVLTPCPECPPDFP